MSSKSRETRLAKLLKMAAKEEDRERLDFLLDETRRLLAGRQKKQNLPPKQK